MRKLTSRQVRAFLLKYATDKSQKVLEIGADSTRRNADIFEDLLTLNIDPDQSPDIVGDAHNLPMGNNSFDVVVCSEVLEHIINPTQAVFEMHRVLKSGGILLLTTRFLFPVHDAPGDFWRFTPYGLREMFKDWDILEEDVESDAFSTVAILLQRIMFQTKLRFNKVTKGLVYLLVLVLNRLDFLIVERYGDITRKSTVPILMSSGVFIACRKK
jgi:SAM-dependent methyltransferase